MERQSILLVDDSPKLLKLGKAIFESGGYNVITANDGVEALNTLSNYTVELVVTDILMPNMDGYSLCYNIRNNVKTRDIPIIVYSATYLSQSDEALALEIGADLFIRKPAAMNFLHSSARDLIAKPRIRRHKTNSHHELLDVTRKYNFKLIEKLEQKNEELEKAQAKLIHNELHLKHAQTIAHLGSWELNFSTGVAVWSEETCRIYGLSPEENLQTYDTWISMIHPNDVGHIMQVNNVARETLSNAAYHHRIIRKDGIVRYVFSEAHFDIDKDGAPIGLHGVVQDETETKEAEMERTKMIADIVQRNEDLEQFSYIISHNLRAPVANILGLVNIIQTTDLNKEEKKMATDYLKIAAENLDKTIMDINVILEINNKVSEKRVTVTFTELLNEIKSSLDNVIRNEKASITGDFSAIAGMITLRGYLYSIFLNLISNSIKYRRQGTHPEVKITSSIVNDKIRITFQDNGMGIDLEKNSKKLFGLYKRFHLHVDGKGMGLYMVKTQVESLGGKINVSSEVNKGTEFRIEFDLIRA